MTGAKVEDGVGRCLREVRKARGWSQAELAWAAGISATALSRLETGKLSPEAGTVRLLLAVMGFQNEAWRLLEILRQRGVLGGAASGGTPVRHGGPPRRYAARANKGVRPAGAHLEAARMAGRR